MAEADVTLRVRYTRAPRPGSRPFILGVVAPPETADKLRLAHDGYGLISAGSRRDISVWLAHLIKEQTK